MCRFIVCIIYIHRYTSSLTEAALINQGRINSRFCYKSYYNIGCDDDDEEEVDSDDMEYTEDATDNMILEFSGD
jgi:hypothetical protein